VRVTTDLSIESIDGDLPVPWRVDLANGSQVTILYSHLRTGTLVFGDNLLDPSVGGGSGGGSQIQHALPGGTGALPSTGATVRAASVTIDHSTLIGSTDSGFNVDLWKATGALTIRASTLDYPHAIGVSVGEKGWSQFAPHLGGGRIEVSNSTIRSLGTNSYGIVFTTSSPNGVAMFAHDRFEVSPGVASPRLVADSCREDDVQGDPYHCNGMAPTVQKKVFANPSPGSYSQLGRDP
jgi:hypothetical protein